MRLTQIRLPPITNRTELLLVQHFQTKKMYAHKIQCSPAKLRPKVCSPTGTVMGAPVSSTCWPRVSPSVPSMAMVLTMFSPKCWATCRLILLGDIMERYVENPEGKCRKHIKTKWIQKGAPWMASISQLGMPWKRWLQAASVPPRRGDAQSLAPPRHSKWAAAPCQTARPPPPRSPGSKIQRGDNSCKVISKLESVEFYANTCKWKAAYLFNIPQS